MVLIYLWPYFDGVEDRSENSRLNREDFSTKGRLREEEKAEGDDSTTYPGVQIDGGQCKKTFEGVYRKTTSKQKM